MVGIIKNGSFWLRFPTQILYQNATEELKMFVVDRRGIHVTYTSRDATEVWALGAGRKCIYI